uniref:Uncharacterized protein n=1 Tax=Cyprinodon variegatus TaxID=28743 RepID=A0A3Q2DNR1_CYPVA
MVCVSSSCKRKTGKLWTGLSVPQICHGLGLIAELQTSVCDSKEEAVRLQQAMEKQLKEVNARWDEERQTITQNAEQANKALLEKVENLQRQLHCAEKKLLSKELESEERVHQEYEEKIKGLMPADLRQELEDTITYLKAQVRNYLVKINKILHNSAESYNQQQMRRNHR